MRIADLGLRIEGPEVECPPNGNPKSKIHIRKAKLLNYQQEAKLMAMQRNFSQK
jgi:hypothetical protein